MGHIKWNEEEYGQITDSEDTPEILYLRVTSNLVEYLTKLAKQLEPTEQDLRFQILSDAAQFSLDQMQITNTKTFTKQLRSSIESLLYPIIRTIS